MNLRLPCALTSVALLSLTPAAARAQGMTQTDNSITSSTAPTPQGDQAQGKKLEDEEKKDSGRIFELVWANVEGGFSYINMQQLSNSNLQLQNATSAGGMVGVGAGIRLLILTLGVRARLHDLSAFTFWELNGEIGFHIPIKRWDPYFAIHGGYAADGSFGSSVLTPPMGTTANPASALSIHGADAGLSVGLDYYIFPLLSLGADFTGEALFLQRPPVPLPAGIPPSVAQMLQNQPLYAATGDSIGLGLSGSIHLGLHI